MLLKDLSRSNLNQHFFYHADNFALGNANYPVHYFLLPLIEYKRCEDCVNFRLFIVKIFTKEGYAIDA